LPCARTAAHGKNIAHGKEGLCRVPRKKTHGKDSTPSKNLSLTVDL